MPSRSSAGFVRFAFLMLVLAATGASAQAEEWQVAKASGDVWLTSSNAQLVSLTAASVLRPGEKIQTGRNGRVLLTRGAETILIAPNSLMGLAGATDVGACDHDIAPSWVHRARGREAER